MLYFNVSLFFSFLHCLDLDYIVNIFSFCMNQYLLVYNYSLSLSLSRARALALFILLYLMKFSPARIQIRSKKKAKTKEILSRVEFLTVHQSESYVRSYSEKYKRQIHKQKDVETLNLLKGHVL